MSTYQNYAVLSEKSKPQKEFPAVGGKSVRLIPPKSGSLEKYDGTLSFVASVRPSGCNCPQCQQQFIAGVT
uniref:Uncharacterized protein n=1 Tax=viral metagenome TaxID=1070528 RepID=A0A6C0EM88_9ZZZZ